jgi:hypothetical protein
MMELRLTLCIFFHCISLTGGFIIDILIPESRPDTLGLDVILLIIDRFTDLVF